MRTASSIARVEFGWGRDRRDDVAAGAEWRRPERSVFGGLGSSAESVLMLHVSGLGVDRAHMWPLEFAGAHTIR